MNKTSNYWDKRVIARLSEAEKLSEDYLKRIKRIYDQAYKNIDDEITEVYKNYAKETGLDIQKLKELLTRSETKKMWKQMKRQGLDKYILDNYKSRITRLEQIQAQIYAKIKLIYPKEKIEQTNCYKGILNNSYYKAVYDTQMGTGFDFSFNRIDNNLINTLLNERWSGKNYSERIWGNTDVLANSISEIIGGVLLSGQDIEKTSRQIRERFNVGSYYAKRLVRTEANHFHNEADALAYEEMGIYKYVFVATLDNRTSMMCQENDNEVYNYKDRQIGINFPPLHPNCRSTTRGYLGEEAEKLLQRRARNPIAGESEIVDNMSYSEWITKHNKQLKSPNYDINNHNLKLRDTKTPGDKIYNAFVENGYENVGLVDKKGNILGKIHTSSKYSSIGYSDSQLNIMKDKYRELTSIHTHPGDDTFSIEDIMDFIERDSICDIMVETPNYEFYLKPDLSTLESAKENITEFEEWLKTSIGIYNDNNYNKLSRLKASERLDKAYEEIFDLIGWEYGKRKK